jgi:hypothetical protein
MSEDVGGPAAPLVTLHRMIPGARAPQRADRTAGGTLPARAAQYCEAVTAAAAFGWYVFAPLPFSLLWDGRALRWTWPDADRWLPLGAAQYPGYARAFDAVAPAALRGCSPPLLTALPEPGLVQIWTGLFARTAPDWSLLVRAPANMPRAAAWDVFEGIVETDHWFGPLFVNLRLTRTDTPIDFDPDVPLLQVQPLPRPVYRAETLDRMAVIDGPSALAPRDWADYERSVIRPVDDRALPGRYAVAARRRRKSA